MSAAVGDRVELRIERLAAGGDGIGRLDGLAVFVPLTAPGDLARVQLVRRRPRFARAELLEVLEPGPERRAAPCPYTARCGGCSWQHLTEPAQRHAKDQITSECLRRIGGLNELPAIEQLVSPAGFGYRSRARVAWEAGRIGFRARGSHEVVDIERCMVLTPETQCELEALRRRRPAGRGELELRGYGSEVCVAGRRYRLGAGRFFQVNRLLWEAWLTCVLEACGDGELAVELYAGSGFYTAGLCDRFRQVVAVERDSRAADDARHNSRARVIDAPAEDWAPALLELAADAVLVNPPRGGCQASVLAAIRNAAPSHFVYVSCDPATLARDLRALGSDYRLRRLVAIDAFPQTAHVEVACVLDRLTPRRDRT